MSKYLRYQQPEVCNHLAAQYVAGHLTPRARRRMEQLIAVTPALKEAVADWSDQLAPVHMQLSESQVPDQIWNGIQEHLFETDNTDPKPSTAERLLGFWRRLGVSSAMASVALAVVLIWQTSMPVKWQVRGADYLAPMQVTVASTPASGNGVQTLPADQEDLIQQVESDQSFAFVITGYQGQNPGESFISLQWSKGAPHPERKSLHLWAENREDQSLTYLGPLPEAGKPWFLEKPQWAALTHSGRLLVNGDATQLQPSRYLYEGPCLQLTGWKQSKAS